MIIGNGNVFCEDGVFRKGALQIKGKRIVAVCTEEAQNIIETEVGEEFIDARGMYVIPGLVDIHLHGCAGYDFCDGTFEAFQTMEEYQLQNGVTSIVPATMTLPARELLRIVEAAGKYMSEGAPVMKGITMEGPFISAAKKGAQNEGYIRTADKALFEQLQEAAGGRIKQVAVAPECAGSMDFIRQVSNEVVVSVAHTEASYEQTMEAFEAGANHVTHLFNAMPPLNHREPGVVGAAFDNKDVFVELICDGEHVHPSVVRAVFQMFGADRICMISDSMSATGMPDGEYALGGQPIWVKEGRAVLESGHLAASVCNLYDCFKKVVLEMGVPLEAAVKACTITPARSLGLQKECGLLAEGFPADMLLLDEGLERKYVIKAGRFLS